MDAGTNAGRYSLFGTSVAVDGNTIVVSQREDTYNGTVNVFTKNFQSQWARVARQACRQRHGRGLQCYVSCRIS